MFATDKNVYAWRSFINLRVDHPMRPSFSDLKTLLALVGEKLISPDYCSRSAARLLETIFSGIRWHAWPLPARHTSWITWLYAPDSLIPDLSRKDYRCRNQPHAGLRGDASSAPPPPKRNTERKVLSLKTLRGAFNKGLLLPAALKYHLDCLDFHQEIVSKMWKRKRIRTETPQMCHW